MQTKKGFQIILVLMLSCGAVFFCLDWITYFQGLEMKLTGPDLSRVLKRVYSLCAVVLVFLLPVSEDVKKMRLILAVFFVADFLLFLKAEPGGVLLFMAGLVLLIKRTLSGFSEYYSSGGKRFQIAGLGVLMLAFYGLLTVFLLYPHLKNHPLFWPVQLYVLVLLAALFSTLLAGFIGYFDRNARVLMILGMASFFLSDLFLGLRIGSEEGMHRNLYGVLVWTFYAPSLLMFALSAGRVSGRKNS